MMRHRHIHRCELLALLTSFFVLGCSDGTGSVSGTVKYKGAALGSGTVVFVGPDGKLLGSAIGSNGEYSISRLAAGKYKVTVETFPPPGAQPMRSIGGRDNLNLADAMTKSLKAKGHVLPATATAPGKYVKIPDRYKQAGNSGLSFEVNGGANTIDLNLVD
jgi:hypothetical protein